MIDSTTPGSPATPSALRSRSRRARKIREGSILSALGLSGLFSILITATIITVLGVETVRFFGMEGVSLREFFLSAKWSPLLGREPSFGIWPLIAGTLLVSSIAMALALPLGLMTAIFLSEYAPSKLRAALKPLLEILAGIPTVVYGFFALIFLTPTLQHLHDGFNVYNAASAGVMVGILCLPIVSSLCEDALRAVPQTLRDGAYGLGGTRFDTSLKVVLPAALSGIVSAFLLAIARAVGETMIVALAAGSMANLTADPREQVLTLTGHMVLMALGDVSNFGVEYRSMYAAAAVLFTITLTLTVLGHLLRRRFRETY